MSGDSYILRDHPRIAPTAVGTRLDLTPSYSPALSSLSLSPSEPIARECSDVYKQHYDEHGDALCAETEYPGGQTSP